MSTPIQLKVGMKFKNRHTNSIGIITDIIICGPDDYTIQISGTGYWNKGYINNYAEPVRFSDKIETATNAYDEFFRHWKIVSKKETKKEVNYMNETVTANYVYGIRCDRCGNKTYLAADGSHRRCPNCDDM